MRRQRIDIDDGKETVKRLRRNNDADEWKAKRLSIETKTKRCMEEFEMLNRIGEGTYGLVYRAKDKKCGEIVAVKKVKEEQKQSGVSEVKILRFLDHPCVVGLKHVVMGKSDRVFLVMEYVENELKSLLETRRQGFSQSEVKCLMQQLLQGVEYLHANQVIHRDLKTSNLLLNNRGELKICDFGIACRLSNNCSLIPHTETVVTLWYRAPELLLGAKAYSTPIDMWSVGCIMAELLSRHPLFDGKTEMDEVAKIFKILGSPNEAIWPGFSTLPGVNKVANFINHNYNCLLRQTFPAMSFTGSPVLSNAGIDLLTKLLTYDPNKRITAKQALHHPWFREVPLPKSKDFMPTFPPNYARTRDTELPTGAGLFGL